MREEYQSPEFFKTSSPDRYDLLKAFARKNRNHPTEAEKALWSMINGMRLGVRFRRQHIINDYIADFVCLEKKLIIEVDGNYHLTDEQKGYDAHRTETLEQFGFQVLRFKNEEVIANTQAVVNAIIDKLEKTTYIYKRIHPI